MPSHLANEAPSTNIQRPFVDFIQSDSISAHYMNLISGSKSISHINHLHTYECLVDISEMYCIWRKFTV